MVHINALPVRNTTGGTVYVHQGSTAKALAIDADIVDICAGPEHCAAIDTSGRKPHTKLSAVQVWTWGCADHGALGHGDSDGPAIVTALGGVDVAAVSCGWQFTIALSTKGDLYAWGAFLDDECHAVPMGQPACINRQFALRRREKFAAIAAGIGHVLALTTRGRVLTWGYGKQYQLGWSCFERHPQQVAQPRALNLQKIVRIASGYFHSFATDAKGIVFAWGLNNAIQTGIEQRKPDYVKIPTRVGDLQDLAITAAKTHTFIRREHGIVITFGTKTTAPLPPIKAVTAGNAFSVALADNSCVYWQDCGSDWEII
ncbi:regulator of chromosome condensation 1/beta-lactamase-inhibitor protein II [Jimgerdemannia flammicorona]|uniref:Regulator of chromosome condensation 1/beta-lactamase-inhibitor protein II n=1 Tax=Jimgerdemannia flammicorona TaxID=994334 RepID=A0A433DGX5_9FUNG|nr:regulator of chromosome condensation 1/beta-lactamase-inhibitor protein II [Jimgerdemannia flammicorona]